MENKDVYIHKLLTSLCPSKANLKRDPWDSTFFMLVRRPIRRGMVRNKEIKKEREIKSERKRQSDIETGRETERERH